MKRLITISLLLVALAVLAVSPCSAADKALSFSMVCNASAPSASDWGSIDTGNTNSKTVFFGGTAGVSSTDAAATLAGNYRGDVWYYQESDDGTLWTTFATLIGNQTVPAYTTTTSWVLNNTYVSSKRYFALGYDATLSSASIASGSGNGSLAIVPEPSGIVALATGAIGLLGLIKRRRS